MDGKPSVLLMTAILVGILAAGESQAQRTFDPQQQRDCPPGQVWGGYGCEIPNLCSDGSLPDSIQGCQTRPNMSVHIPDSSESENDSSSNRDAPINTQRHACENGVLFYSPDTETDTQVEPGLLIVNGSASELFNRYHRELRRKGKQPNWATFKIIFLEAGMEEVTELREGSGVERYSLPKAIKMQSRHDDWIESLQDKEALPLDDDQIDLLIDKYQADAICGR